MSEHPINSMMDVTLQRINEIVDSNTIIGKPIEAGNGVTILPVSRVNFGFVSGGSDRNTKTPKDAFGGGAGAGVTIAPVGFLVIEGTSVRLLQLADKGNTAERLIGMMPEMVDKVQGIVNDFTGKEKTVAAAPAPEKEEA